MLALATALHPQLASQIVRGSDQIRSDLLLNISILQADIAAKRSTFILISRDDDFKSNHAPVTD